MVEFVATDGRQPWCSIDLVIMGMNDSTRLHKWSGCGSARDQVAGPRPLRQEGFKRPLHPSK